MRLVFVLCGALVLCGCASAFDASAVAAAKQVNQVGYDKCNSARGHEIKTYVTLTNCYLASDLVFANSIKLRNMSLYNTYAARIRLLAVDVDAGRVSVADGNSRLSAAGRDYVSAIEQAYAQTAADNAATTNFLVGATAAFATGYAHPIPP